jgi:thiamine kinase-like enzyme
MEGLLAGVPARDADRLSRVPFLVHSTSVGPLDGGITNRNYRVRTPVGDHVVRLSDPESSDLAIDRENEYRNSVAAAQSGAAPEVTAYLPGEGVLVVRWVEGRTFNEDDVADEANLRRIAGVCRTLHAGPAFVNDFDMFDIQERYLRLVQERGYRLPPRYLDFAGHVSRIRAAMSAAPEPRVPCNNDLLAANIIDDGQRLWLIDYEYSGTNEASFELGNVWSESTLPAEALDVLVGAYWEREDRAKVARARLWALMSKYGWTLWASIQASASPIEFDYWSWGMEKYDRAVLEFDGPDFERLLEDVTRED